MFYPVQIFSPKGELTGTIGTAKLSKRHWDMFQEEEKSRFSTRGARKSLRLKKLLDMEFNEFAVAPLLQ